MRIYRRIVKAPSVLNRASIGATVVPKYPKLANYEDRLVGDADVRTFYEIKNACDQNRPMRVYMNYLLPEDVGYLVEHDGSYFAVPVQRLKYFMESNGVDHTKRSKYDVWAEVIEGKITIHNNDPVIECPEVILIYKTDLDGYEETRLPIEETFRVTTERGFKTVRPKGDATVYGVKLANPELLPVLDGEVVDVSRYPQYTIYAD